MTKTHSNHSSKNKPSNRVPINKPYLKKFPNSTPLSKSNWSKCSKINHQFPNKFKVEKSIYLRKFVLRRTNAYKGWKRMGNLKINLSKFFQRFYEFVDKYHQIDKNFYQDLKENFGGIDEFIRLYLDKIVFRECTPKKIWRFLLQIENLAETNSQMAIPLISQSKMLDDKSKVSVQKKLDNLQQYKVDFYGEHEQCQQKFEEENEID